MQKIKKRFNVLFFRCKKKGFTLTEILIVVVIIGILATLALPMFLKSLEKAKVGEAISNLNLIRTGQKIYFLEYSTFSSGIPNLNVDNPNGDPDDTATRYFDYDITASSETDFTARATRGGRTAVDAPSPYQDDEYTISKDGQITGPLL